MKGKNTAEKHQEKICLDTIKNPRKSYFLGGPDYLESRKFLLSIGYSKEELKELEKEED